MPQIIIASADLADNRRFANPVAPWRRGWEDAAYERTYANPYLPSSSAYADYAAAFSAAIDELRNATPAAFRRRSVPVV